MDYEKAKKYFIGVNKTPAIVVGCVGGLILLISLLGGGGVGIFIGIVALAGAYALYTLEKRKVISDRGYDAMVAEKLKSMNVKKRALNKLGLDIDEVCEIAPISFDGYKYKGANAIKKGDDNIWRSNKYEVVMLFFSAHEVHCYTLVFNTTGTKQTEGTDVYFYRDIVSVSTTSDTVKLETGGNFDYEAFQLTTAGGTSISVSLRDVDGVQGSINAMRQLLRAKKQQI